MQLRFLDLYETQISVHNEDYEVEGLGHQAEFPMYIDDPLNQEGAARILDLAFYLDSLQIIRFNPEFHFCFAHVLKYGRCKVCCHLWVPHLHLVCEDHFFLPCLAILDQSLLELLLACLFFVALLRRLA